MKISVIIPTRNRSEFLLEALKSIFAQDYQDFEVIVVDDGSTDDSVRKCNDYLNSLDPEKAEKVSIRLQEFAGAPVARNYGFMVSSSEAVLFMDSDDLLSVHGLALGVERLKTSNADYVYMPVQECTEEGVPIPDRKIGSEFSSEPADICGYHWQTMGAIYRTESILKIGPWNTQLSGSQDWEYQARVKMSGLRGEFVDEIMGYWRMHDRTRIRASQYNHIYVASMERACIEIGKEAFKRKLLDRRLRSRLLRRIVVHALEAGSERASEDRLRLLGTALSFSKGLETFAVYLMSVIRVPSLDRALYHLILANFARKKK